MSTFPDWQQYEALDNTYREISRRFERRRPRAEDRPQIEAWIGRLRLWRRVNACKVGTSADLGAPVVALAAVSSDKGLPTWWAATQDGRLCYLPPGETKLIETRLWQKSTGNHVLGLESYVDRRGVTRIELAFESEASTLTQDVQLDSMGQIALAVPAPPPRRLACLTVGAADQRGRVEALREEAGDRVAVVFLGKIQSASGWDAPAPLRTLVQVDRNVYATDCHAQLHELSIGQDGNIQLTRRKLPAVGHVNALIPLNPPNQHWLLAGGADGHLILLDTVAGHVVRRSLLTAPATCLSGSALPDTHEPSFWVGDALGRVYQMRLLPGWDGNEGAAQWWVEAWRWLGETIADDPAALAQEWLSTGTASQALLLMDWFNEVASNEVIERCWQMAPDMCNRAFALWRRTSPSHIPTERLLESLDSHYAQLNPTARRQVRQMRVRKTPTTLGPESKALDEEELWADWMDLQQGVRRVWSLDLGGPVETLYTFCRPEQRQTWLVAGTELGEVVLVDLTNQQVVQRVQWSAPLRGAFSADPLLPHDNDLWLVSADGLLRHYQIDAEFSLEQPKETTPLADEIWRLTAFCSFMRPFQLVIGAENAILLPQQDLARLTQFNRISHLAAIKPDAQTTLLLTAGQLEMGFALHSLEDPSRSTYVALPTPIVQLLGWADQAGNCCPVAIGADQEVYVFNAFGELQWQVSPSASGLLPGAPSGISGWRPPVADVFPLVSDERTNLVVAVGERAVVYRQRNQRVAELALEAPVSQIQATRLFASTDVSVPALVTATPSGFIHLYAAYGLTDSSRQTTAHPARLIEERHSSADPVSLWLAMVFEDNPDRVSLALSRLGELASASPVNAANMARPLLEWPWQAADLPLGAKIQYARLLIRLLVHVPESEVQRQVLDILLAMLNMADSSEDGAALPRAVILAVQADVGRMVFSSADPPEPWWSILCELVVNPDPVLRRGLTCMVGTTLEKLSLASSDKWWKLARLLLTKGDSPLGDLAATALALSVRDRFHASPQEGWKMAHAWLSRGVPPIFLKPLADTAYPLLSQMPSQRALFEALYYMIMTAPQSAERLTWLTKLAAELTRSATWKGADVMAQTYIGLAKLAQVRDVPEGLAFMEGDSARAPFMATTERLMAEPGWEDVGKVLGENLAVVKRGMADYKSGSIEARRDILRRLIPTLERQKSEITLRAVELSSQGPTVGSALLLGLADILGLWIQPNGIIGRMRDQLENQFEWDIQFLYPQVREGELRLDFYLKNIGLATGYHLEIHPPILLVGDQRYPCDLIPPTAIGESSLEPAKLVRRTLAVTLPEVLSEGDAIVEIEFTIGHTQAGHKQTIKNKTLRIPKAFGAADYTVAFPSAWSLYGKQLRDWYKHHTLPILLIELDYGTQDSFFNACCREVASAESATIDLRDIYNTVRRERVLGKTWLPVRAQDIHGAMTAALQALPEAPRYGVEYRSRFEDALAGPTHPIELLLLESFDYLVEKLLRDPESQSALDEILDYWLDLAGQSKVRLVLGASYLTELMLRARYPDHFAQMQIVRANYLPLHDRSRGEIRAYLDQQLTARGLDDNVRKTLFAHEITLDALIDWCGSNLLFLRYFALGGLEQAHQIARNDRDEEARLRRMSLPTYFLEYGERRNFFRRTWVWLSFYDRLGLGLVAQAEFPVNDTRVLDRLMGLQLSRPYFPGLPPDKRGKPRRATMPLAEPGTMLDQSLTHKIRSSQYFEKDSVWLSGLVTRGAVSVLDQRAGQMLVELLGQVEQRTLLERLVEQGILSKRDNSQLGDVFTFSIPIWRQFFAANRPIEGMMRLAYDDKGGAEGKNWYPAEWHRDYHAPHAVLFHDRPNPEPIYRQLPLADLPAIDTRLSNNPELHADFLNLFGLGIRRRSAWPSVVKLARALANLAAQLDQPSNNDMEELFKPFNDLLGVRRVSSGGKLHEVSGWIPFGGQGVLYQYTHFGEGVMPGLHKNLLIGFVRDGLKWPQGELTQLRERADRYLLRAWEAERNELGVEEETESRIERQVIVVCVLHGADHFRRQLKVLPSQPYLHYVVLSQADLAAVIVSESPARAFMELCQQQVGRSVLSPYKKRGPLEPGSRLFVGRQTELETIVQRIHNTVFVILGSRRIGKTTLLRQVQARLHDSDRFLPLWLGMTSTVDDFYGRIRSALRGIQENECAELIGHTQPGEGLRRALEELRRRRGCLPVLLMDEVDGLHQADHRDGEKLFGLLRDLTQATPPICGSAMTGYREVYRQQFDNNCVFYNFGEVIFLREVADEELNRLIDLLGDYGVRFYHAVEARARILEGTYHIPYLVQTACDQLLERLDNPQRQSDRVERDDVAQVLNEQIADELMDDLVLKIRVEREDSFSAETARLRLRIMLYTIILGKYGYALDMPGDFHRLPEAERIFRPADVIGHLDVWADEARHVWKWRHDEIEQLLQELRMTLAVSTVEPRDHSRYYFPQDIVPRLLHNRYKGVRRSSLIDDLAEAIKDLEQHMRKQSS